MEMAEATPRPWVLGKVGDGGYSDRVAPCHIWTSKGPGYGLVATTAPHCQPYEKQRIDAELIVRAVNAHDSLVEALRDCVALIRGDIQGPIQRRGILRDADTALRLANSPPESA